MEDGSREMERKQLIRRLVGKSEKEEYNKRICKENTGG